MFYTMRLFKTKANIFIILLLSLEVFSNEHVDYNVNHSTTISKMSRFDGLKNETSKPDENNFADDFYKMTNFTSDFDVRESMTHGFNDHHTIIVGRSINATVRSSSAEVDSLVDQMNLLGTYENTDNTTARTQINLRVNFTSETEGSVESPHWSRLTWLTDTTMISAVRVDAPDKHVLLVSWWIRLQFPCADDVLELYADENASRVSAVPRWSLCGAGRHHPRPELFHADAFRVRFALRPEAAHRARGFRLLFSFHERSAPPRQLSADGPWNCSLPHWPHFRQHVLCNLHVECAGGEDEASCGHESEGCGPGRISAAGGCYVYVASHAPVSWNEARVACRREGGYLASFNTEQERQAVGRYLKKVSAFYLHVGLMSQNPRVPDMYRDIPTWDDETIAYYAERLPKDANEFCSSVDFSWDTGDYVRLKEVSCRHEYPADILCEIAKPPSHHPEAEEIVLPNVTSTKPNSVTLIECPAGHVTHTALACDVSSACWGQGHGSDYTCDARMTSLPPSFVCASEVQFVPYSLLCDYQEDCADGSDEEFCIFPPCGFEPPFPCGNKQCISHSSECNGKKDCTNGLDERMCFRRANPLFSVSGLEPLPYVIGPSVNTFRLTTECFSIVMCDNVFTCSTTDISMPLFLRCNGINDCPGREDERNCDTCPGLYRCRGSQVCLHVDSICDGERSCPQNDDELFCRLSCPQNCTCHALSARCRHRFSARHIPDLRFLEARGSGMTLADLSDKTMLVHLDLAACGLRFLDRISLPNVLFLDINDNLLTYLTFGLFILFPNLRELVLDGNPLESVFLRGAKNANLSFIEVLHLKMSRVIMKDLDTDTLTVFPNLEVLNLSGSRVENIHGQGLKVLTELTTLDVRECSLTSIPSNILRNLHKLKAVFADNYKLCCPATLPVGFNLAHCHAPRDVISSCDALLRSDVYRVLLSVFSVLAVVGNLGSFSYRVIINRSHSDLGFGVFVTHLCVSDLLMGIYLAVIGVADRVYLGTYLWDDITWKHSTACSMAGFLSLLSSEVSAFLICLITLDRVIVLRFPFRQLRFHPRSAHVASVFAWTSGVVLAALPLLPVTSHWQFYSQNGICLPLPVTQRQFPGQHYSFAVFIILNFLLFLLIAVGQFSILYVVRTSRLASTETNQVSKDVKVARRLITVAMSDFLCWFPIGMLGLLASKGYPIPGEVNVVMAILALPLNAALNPFLYTFNVIKEHRRRDGEKRLRKIITMAQERDDAENCSQGLI